jgi:hypothetical protein
MKSVTDLTPEQQAALADASRKVRPNAEQRRQFAELKRAWREIKEAA